jgi:hypothetical protein
MIFYTTKPWFFIDEWISYAFFASFMLSVISIPVVESISQPQNSDSRYRGFGLVLASAWLTAVVISSLLVRFITAIVHRITLNIPDGLVPIGLMFIPIAAIATLWFIGFRKAKRRATLFRVITGVLGLFIGLFGGAITWGPTTNHSEDKNNIIGLTVILGSGICTSAAAMLIFVPLAIFRSKKDQKHHGEGVTS